VDSSDAYAVVIVTYNHAATLPACLQAAKRLDPPPASLVVVDNASEDCSASTAEPSVDEVIREASNTGFAAAANRGVAATATPWVLLLNPDCAPRPDYVGRLLRTLASTDTPASVGALTGKLLRGRGHDLEATATVDSAGMVVTPAGRHLDRGAGEPDDGSFDAPAWVFGGTGAATLFRREALVDVAYADDEFFAESFFAYREDAELAWRLQLRGWQCLYEPKAVAVHRRGFRPERGRVGHEHINRHSVRNRFLLRLHCADLSWHLRSLPWWLLRDLLVFGASLTVERSSLPAFGELWRLRRDALERRRWVLGRRTAPPQQIQRWFRKRGRIEEIAVN